MANFFDDWSGAGQLADRVDEILRVEHLATLIALITTGSLITTMRTSSFDITVSEELLCLFVIRLFELIFDDVAIVVKIIEDCLSVFYLGWMSGSSKMIKADVEPAVDFLVYLIIFVTDRLGGKSFFFCFDLSRSAMFVSTADVEDLLFSVARTSVSRIDIC